MGYSMKDLENAARGINERREERARQKGEELANKLLEGRGLWKLIHALVAIAFGLMFWSGIAAWLWKISGENFLIAAISVPVAFLVFKGWYNAKFTINHPFISPVLLVTLGSAAMAILFDKLGVI